MSQVFVNRLIWVVAVIVTSSANIAKADLVIEIRDTTVRSGGRGFIDVLVSSDSADTFSLFNYKLAITPVSVFAGGVLEFQPSFSTDDPFRQNNNEQTRSNYIFHGSTDPANFFAVRQDPDRSKIVGGDVRVDGNSTFLSPDQYLLARVELQHITPTPGVSTGTFRVSLVEDPGQTYFQNLDLDDSDPLQPKIDAISYSLANTGIVNVVAVPEPSSLVLLSTACGLCFFRRGKANKLNPLGH